MFIPPASMPSFRLLLSLLFCSLCLLATAASAQMARGPQLTPTALLNTSHLQPGSQHVIALTFDIPENHYTQSNTPTSQDFIAFEVTAATSDPAITTYAPVYPPGISKTYPVLGSLNVFSGKLSVFIPITVSTSLNPSTTSSVTFSGEFTAQVCNQSVCFPPQTKPWSLTVPVAAPTSTSVTSQHTDVFAAFDFSTFARLQLPSAARPQTDSVNLDFFGFSIGSLSSNNYAFTFVIALAVGLLFNVMPCVLPVLPLKAIGFYEVSQHNPIKSISLGLVFSLGMISLFGLLGALIVLGGQQWGQLFSQSWFVYSISALLLLATAAQFGFLEVVLPSRVYSLQPGHDTYLGNFLFGAFTAILSAPCTAPMLPGIILWSAKFHADTPAIGLSLFLAVGLGMALPYALLAGFPQIARRIPRSGPWNVLLKQMMGFALLAMVVYFLAPRLLPDFPLAWAVAIVVLISALFLVIQTLRLMPRPLPIATSIALALVLATSSTALASYFSRPTANWTYYTEETFAAAQSSGRPFLIKFTADWCANCHVVESAVFGDEKTAAFLADHNVLLLKADLTDSSAPGWKLLSQLSPGGGIPFTAIYAPSGKLSGTLESIYTTDALQDAINRIPPHPQFNIESPRP